MVILLCSTPRRGMVAVATHGTPSGYPTAISKRALLYSPKTVGKPTTFLDPDRSSSVASSRDQSPSCDIDGGDPVLILSPDSNCDRLQQQRRYSRDESEPVSERDVFPFVEHRSRSPTKKKMSATPTYGHSCFPFAVNCRFSKTFFGVPKKCGYCQKIIVGTGFACQNCRFRCHKKCIMIGRGPQVCLRPKPCSLSRLPPGDEALINKLLKEHEINSNDIDSVFAESEQEDDDLNNHHHHNHDDAGSDVLTAVSSRRPSSRPSLANSSSFVGGVRSIVPSLTTSDEPSMSPPPSPPASVVSLSASNPSSPTYPSNGGVECGSSRSRLQPPTSQRHRNHHSRHHHQQQQQQQQRSTNMFLLALAAGAERRPSSSSTTSSSKRDSTNPSSSTLRQPSTSNNTNASFMDRFFKLFPSWTSAHKEGAGDEESAAENLKTTPRSCSVISAASSVSMAAHSAAVSESGEKESAYVLPRAVSASATVANTKRPYTLSACSTTSQAGYSASSSVRTPVDEFNSSVLEDLFAASQATNNIAAVANTAKLSVGAIEPPRKSSQFLRRKLLWAKHIAGDRSARSQDCVTGMPGDPEGPAMVNGLNWAAIRGRSATLRPEDNSKNGINGSRNGLSGRKGSTKGRLGNRLTELTIDGGQFGLASLERTEKASDESSDNGSRVHDERLANTWPLSGLHINHDEHETEEDDTAVCSEVREMFQVGDEYENDDDHSDETRRQARLSDLGEWTIAYDDLQFGECVHECRNMTTYKGRWHGDVMIHKFDMHGTESDRLMRSFLDDVRTLTKIRHENVALFMGASIEAPQVAVVTSVRKGDSLYKSVHHQSNKLSQHAKLNIVRQVAQGMGYLHAKGIVLKSLTSKSIYLECKVKISTLDDGAPLKRHDTLGTGCVRRGHLTYISPELMQTLRVAPPALIVDGIPTKESDVYAFGTILYELYAGDFPFAQLTPEAIVWTIGNERRQDVEGVRCNVTMKSLIEDCWSPDPTYRPSFTQVLKDLQRTAALHKKHSSSVPEKLNKTGLHRSPFNY